MPNAASSRFRTGESLFGQLYLVGVVLVLLGLFAYFAALIHSSPSDPGKQNSVAVAEVSSISLAYTIALWIMLPALLVIQQLRRIPKRQRILISAEGSVPIVHAKQPETVERSIKVGFLDSSAD